MPIAHFVSVLGNKSIGHQKGRLDHSVILAILMVDEKAYDRIERDEIGAIYCKRL